MYYFMIDWVQYCVKLKKGAETDLDNYTRVPKEKVESFFKNFRFGEETKNVVDMSYRIGQKKREFNDKIHFYKRNLGSLVFDCENKETANKCAGLLDFPLPFPDK